ncbi:hypothetical protein OQA88_1655 [Cercophora sp. LCS_1]
MPPRTSTARTRQAPGHAAHDDSDSENERFEARLKEAAAARARLKKAKDDRDKKREALSVAFQRSISTIQNRVQKSITKYKDLHTAMHMRRLKHLQKAVETRDEKLTSIAKKLVDMQAIMVDHGTQLGILYSGRRRDVAALAARASAQAKVRS